MSFLFSLRSFRASHKADVLAVNSDSFSLGLILLDVEFLVDSVVVFPPSVSPAACWPPLFLTRGQLGAAQVPSLVPSGMVSLTALTVLCLHFATDFDVWRNFSSFVEDCVSSNLGGFQPLLSFFLPLSSPVGCHHTYDGWSPTGL